MSKDPTKKYNVRLMLEEFIYKPAETQLEKKLNAIMNSHSIDDPHRSMAFMFKGQVYAPKDYRSPGKITLLSRRLYPNMEEWLKETNKLQEEKTKASNYLTCILNEAKNLADLQALLPECLHPGLGIIGSANLSSLLTPEHIEAVNHQHTDSIQMIKERLVLNLLI